MESNAFLEKNYKDCQELVSDFLFNRLSIFSQGLIFRGEASSVYNLIPSVFRLTDEQKKWFFCKAHLSDNGECEFERKLVDAEYHNLNMFYKSADARGLTIPFMAEMHHQLAFSPSLKVGDNWISKEYLELAGLAQHYGMPTRLLDWSSDFFVALYFACVGAIKNLKRDNNSDDKMVIWALNYPLFEMGKYLTIPSRIKIIRPPYFGNPNLSAQAGVFTIYEKPNPEAQSSEAIDKTPFNEIIIKEINRTIPTYSKTFEPAICKFTIPITQCYKLYKILLNMNYDASRIFPGYSSIVKKFQQDSDIMNN